MSGKKYYWLKLKDDFFNQKEIKRLRRIAGGDTYTIIYLKMLLLSLKNEGKIYFDEVCENFSDELSLEIDEDVENVQMTLSYLQSKGLLEIINDSEYFMSDIPAMIGSESESANRVRKHREKQKTLQCNAQTLLGNSEVTKGNTEIEKEKEKDIYSNEFEQFWSIYPRKVDKKKALKSFKSCLKNYSLDTVLKGTKKYALQVKHTEKQYIKHPATFLNNESFIDGFEEVVTQEVPKQPVFETSGALTGVWGDEY
jgi:predicted phage replisome organizer